MCWFNWRKQKLGSTIVVVKNVCNLRWKEIQKPFLDKTEILRCKRFTDKRLNATTLDCKAEASMKSLAQSIQSMTQKLNFVTAYRNWVVVNEASKHHLFSDTKWDCTVILKLLAVERHPVIKAKQILVPISHSSWTEFIKRSVNSWIVVTFKCCKNLKHEFSHLRSSTDDVKILIARLNDGRHYFFEEVCMVVNKLHH